MPQALHLCPKAMHSTCLGGPALEPGKLLRRMRPHSGDCAPYEIEMAPPFSASLSYRTKVSSCTRCDNAKASLRHRAGRSWRRHVIRCWQCVCLAHAQATAAKALCSTDKHRCHARTSQAQHLQQELCVPVHWHKRVQGMKPSRKAHHAVKHVVTAAFLWFVICEVHERDYHRQQAVITCLLITAQRIPVCKPPWAVLHVARAVHAKSARFHQRNRPAERAEGRVVRGDQQAQRIKVAAVPIPDALDPLRILGLNVWILQRMSHSVIGFRVSANYVATSPLRADPRNVRLHILRCCSDTCSGRTSSTYMEQRTMCPGTHCAHGPNCPAVKLQRLHEQPRHLRAPAATHTAPAQTLSSL